MKRNVFFGGLLFVLVMVLAGCGNTKEVAYFQDVRDGLDLAETVSKELVLREGDKLTIVVNSYFRYETLIAIQIPEPIAYIICLSEKKCNDRCI